MIFTFAFLEEQIFVCPKGSWLTKTGNIWESFHGSFKYYLMKKKIAWKYSTPMKAQSHEGLVEDDFPFSVTTGEFEVNQP